MKTFKNIFPLTFLIVTFLLMSFLTSCNNKVDTKSGETNVQILVEEWNKAHISKDVGILSNLYDGSIFYYGTQKDKNACLENKLSLFKKYPDYYQQIFGEIETEQLNETEFKCTFIKRVTFNQKTNDYPSYLIFSQKQNEWKITTEGDLVTDKNLAKAKNIKVPDNAVKGDFNGDGVLDYAWLVPSKKSECVDCEGNCVGYVNFSDSSIPEIKITSYYNGGSFDVLEDLNNDRANEIGVLRMTCNGCWSNYEVYTLKNNKWILAVEPFTTFCDQWDNGIKPIEIDHNKKGNVLIRYTESGIDGNVIKTKSVSIK